MNKKQVVLHVAFISIFSMAFAAAPVVAGYGSSPSNNGGSSAPVCDNEVPGKPSFTFVRKSGSDQIEIGWNATPKATKWTVAYGKEKGKYIYGISDFGDENSRSIKISLLPQGVYYVVVKANNGCKPGPFSDERKITVTSGGQVLGARTFKPFTGTVLGTNTASPTPTPTANTGSPTPAPSSNSGSEPRLNFFQKLFKFIFG